MTIRHSCMRNKIRDIIVERILDGTYPAGMRLKELVLAAEFDVSQTPLREALRELEALGLVASEHYRGTHVLATDVQQLREAYELRAMLEERAAQLAVPCSPHVLETLRKELERMRSTWRRRHLKEHAAAAAAFHRTLIAASGNSTLLRVWDSLYWEIRIRVAIQQTRKQNMDGEAFFDIHESVLKLLTAGDGRTAGQELRRLMDDVLKAMAQDQPISKPARTTRRKRAGDLAAQA